MSAIKKLLFAGAVVLWLPALAGAQEVFREISSQRLEDILKSMNIDFNKGTGEKGVTFYNYKSKNTMLRLWNFNGKDLMVDVFLPKVEWDVVNKWNTRAKFSRARLYKDNKGEESAVLEWNIDLAGGATEEAIKHFIRSFDIEVAQWANTATPATADEEIFNNVSPDRLEKVLNAMNIQFKKEQGKGSNVLYYFDRNNYRIRLVSFGGQDLMIDCNFEGAPLAKVNQWNVKRSYVRAVLYPGAGKPFTALECNLDCVGGTSEGILRYFINAFDSEVTAFDDHLKKG
jgi:Putative bacterial sensory transduction regulator